MDQQQRPEAYRVLARAYRPARLSALIGQEALVRTLQNAFASAASPTPSCSPASAASARPPPPGSSPAASTAPAPTARARPTPRPCGVCPSCVAIDGDRSLDVIEMDAASQTGKDDVLELLEGIQFVPSSSRFKVYILDEVHMLSPKAFNALLKTVEEPPPHVKFIFATTEVRKVPVTVLSRCQRFELRRVDVETLASHLEAICAKEGVQASADALALIARAAEGSVRDALPCSTRRSRPAKARSRPTSSSPCSASATGCSCSTCSTPWHEVPPPRRWTASPPSTSSARTPPRWPRTCSRSATGCRG